MITLEQLAETGAAHGIRVLDYLTPHEWQSVKDESQPPRDDDMLKKYAAALAKKHRVPFFSLLALMRELWRVAYISPEIEADFACTRVDMEADMPDDIPDAAQPAEWDVCPNCGMDTRLGHKTWCGGHWSGTTYRPL